MKIINATIFTNEKTKAVNYTGLVEIPGATVTEVAVIKDAEGTVFGIYPQNQYFVPVVENGEKKLDADGKPVMQKKYNVAITGNREELNAKVAELYEAGKVKLFDKPIETSIGTKLGTVTVEGIDVKVSVRVELTKEGTPYMIPPRAARPAKEGDDASKPRWWYYVNISQEDRDRLAAEIVANAKEPAPKTEG